MKKLLGGVRGKQILVSGLAVLVLAAGYYRWSVGKDFTALPTANDALPAENAETAAEGDSNADYFSKARYERDCARSEAAELVKTAAQDGEENKDTSEKLAKYAKNTESETAIENMVKAKGYADCVAFVDDAGVRVVVKSEGLEADGVAKIKDIVIEQTGVRATDIKISNKN